MSKPKTSGLKQRPVFATAQEAEVAFYEAFEHRDFHAMMAVWAEDDSVICIHPGAPRLSGIEQVAISWKHLFETSPLMRFRLTDGLYTQDAMLAIHQIRENIEVDGEESGVVLTTNIFQFIDGSWRMVIHHASPEMHIHETDDDDDDEEEVVLH